MKKLIASILAAAALTGAVFAQGAQLKTVALQKGIVTNGIKKLQISLKDESLTIKQNDDSTVKTIDIEILSTHDTANPLFTNDGKMLKIEQKEKTNKLKDRVCYVNITIPKDFSIQEAKIATVTKDITISDLNSQKMEISSTSGAVKLTNIEANELTVSADKGGLTAKKIKADKIIRISTSSGDQTFSELKADEIIAETQKGTLKFTDIDTKKVSFNVDKGVLELNLKALFEKDSTVRVSSGNAKIFLPSNSTFWTSGSVDRGRFRSEFAQDSKGPLLNMKVGGGDMQLLKD